MSGDLALTPGMTSRASVVAFTVFASGLTFAAQGDPAAIYPSKPIRFIVPYAPGAGTDTTARTIASKLAQQWGQQVVVDNRTGGGGAVGIEYTANANPDGYTIGLVTASHTTAQDVKTDVSKWRKLIRDAHLTL